MQKIDRREMFRLSAKGAAGVALASAVPSMEGCNASAWIQTAINDLPTILQIVTTIISVVGAAGINVDPATITYVNEIGFEVKTDLQLAETLISTYEKSPSGGLLTQIDNILITVQGSLQAVLTALHIKDESLQATVAASIGAAITIVVALQSIVPAPPASNPARKAMGNPEDNSVAIKKAFNTIVTGRLPDKVLL